jgi:hypothetical protein
LPGRVKKQDVYILIFGMEQESRKIFSIFTSKNPFSRIFQVIYDPLLDIKQEARKVSTDLSVLI